MTSLHGFIQNRIMTVIICLLVAVSTAVAGSQPMMISRTGTLRISGGNRTVSTPAYCLNQRLSLPKKTDRYQHFNDPKAVKVVRTPKGGQPLPPMSLPDAIDNGHLAIRGDEDLSLTFEALDDAEYTIEIMKPMVAATEATGISTTSDVAKSSSTVQQIESLLQDSIRDEGGLGALSPEESAQEITQQLTWALSSNPSKKERDAVYEAVQRLFEEDTYRKLEPLLQKLEKSSSPEHVLARSVTPKSTKALRAYLTVHDEVMYVVGSNGDVIRSILSSSDLPVLSELLPEGTGDVVVSSELLSHDRYSQLKVGAASDLRLFGSEPDNQRIVLKYSADDTLGSIEAAALDGAYIPDGLRVELADVAKPRMGKGTLLLPKTRTQGQSDGRAELLTALNLVAPTSRAKVASYCSEYSELSAEVVSHIERVVEAPRVEANIENSALTLRRKMDGQNENVSLEELASLTVDDVDFDDLWIVDIRQIKDNKQLKSLCDSVSQFEERTGVEVYLATSEESEARFATMYNPSSVTLATDDSIRRIPGKGEEAYTALKEFEKKTTGSATGRVEVLAGHDGPSEQIVGQWLQKAVEGQFKDKHLIIVACNVAPQSAMFDVARKALDNGALSVVCADDALQAHAFTLATSRLERIPLEDQTPLSFWRDCYHDASATIRRVLDSPDPQKAAVEEFGSAGKLLLDGDGKIHQRTVEKLLEYLEALDPSLYHQFGMKSRTTLLLIA